MCPSLSIFGGAPKKAFREVWTWKSTRYEISHLSFDYTKFDTNAMQKCHNVFEETFLEKEQLQVGGFHPFGFFFVSFIFHLRWKAQALPHVSRARSATQKSSKKGPQYPSPRHSVVNNCVMLVTVINKGPGCRISHRRRNVH